MSRRTTPTLVRSIHPNIPSSINLDGFIDTATKMVDKLSTCAGTDLDDQQLELIERWLSAHYYTITNPQARSKSIGSASKSWNVAPVMGKGLEATPYGQQALALDTSGCLDSLTGEKMGVTWLGSDETEYDESRWD